MNKTEIKVGQKWKNRLGTIVTIEDYPGGEFYKFKAVTKKGIWNTVTSSGRYFDDTILHNKDLLVLIQDVTEQQPTENKMKDELNEKKYSKQMIEDAKRFLYPNLDDWQLTNELVNAMEKQSDSEYQEYLRLKEKFKNC